MTVMKKQAEDKTTQPKASTPKKNKHQELCPTTHYKTTNADDPGYKAVVCAKLAKRGKLEEDPDAARCTHCNAPGQEEPTCYFGANKENRPTKKTSPEAQKKLLESYKNSNKHINPKHPDNNLHHRRI